MCEALNELFAEELKEADLRGRKEERKELVQKKLAKNQSIERIAEDLVEDVEVIRKIAEEIKKRVKIKRGCEITAPMEKEDFLFKTNERSSFVLKLTCDENFNYRL